jgi:hypothetical protein
MARSGSGRPKYGMSFHGLGLKRTIPGLSGAAALLIDVLLP